MRTGRLAVIGFLLALAAPLQAGHVNTTYRVVVVSSFGTTFTDCFRFDNPASGDLSIDALGQVLTYRHGQLDTVPSRFKAVTRFIAPFEIMFFGEFFDPLNQMTGEAINEFGDTFVFSGPSDAACVPTMSESATNPYSR